MTFMKEVAEIRKKLTKEEFEAHAELSPADRQRAFSKAANSEALKEQHAKIAEYYAAMEQSDGTESPAYTRLRALEAGPTLWQKFIWGLQNFSGPLGFCFKAGAWILKIVFNLIKIPLSWLFENIGIGWTAITIPIFSFLWLTFFAAYYSLGGVFLTSLIGNFIAGATIALAADITDGKNNKKNPLGACIGFLVMLCTLGISFWKTPIFSDNHNIILHERDGKIINLIDNKTANFCDAPNIFRGDNFIYQTSFEVGTKADETVPFKHGKAKFAITCKPELNFEVLKNKPLTKSELEAYKRDLEKKVLEVARETINLAAQDCPDARKYAFTDDENEMLASKIKERLEKIVNPIFVINDIRYMTISVDSFRIKDKDY